MCEHCKGHKASVESLEKLGLADWSEPLTEKDRERRFKIVRDLVDGGEGEMHQGSSNDTQRVHDDGR